MRTTFLNRTIHDPEPPQNLVGRQEADIFCVCPETNNPNEGLSYIDFSLNNLINSGATDLMSRSQMLEGNQFNVQDLANQLADSFNEPDNPLSEKNLFTVEEQDSRSKKNKVKDKDIEKDDTD